MLITSKPRARLVTILRGTPLAAVAAVALVSLGACRSSDPPAKAADAPPPPAVAAPAPRLTSADGAFLAGTFAERGAAVDAPSGHDFRADVRVDDKGTYLVSGATLHKIVTEPASVARQARLVPSIKDGRAYGFKVFAIRIGSIYQALGFENGDTLLAINGLQLTSPERALAAYAQLKDERRWTVALMRRGETRQHHIAIAD